MISAAALAVVLYVRSERPAWITAGAGARIGLAGSIAQPQLGKGWRFELTARVPELARFSPSGVSSWAGSNQVSSKSMRRPSRAAPHHLLPGVAAHIGSSCSFKAALLLVLLAILLQLLLLPLLLGK